MICIGTSHQEYSSAKRSPASLSTHRAGSHSTYSLALKPQSQTLMRLTS